MGIPRVELTRVEDPTSRQGSDPRVNVEPRRPSRRRDSVDRASLRAQYVEAARRVRESALAECAELDGLTFDGLGEE
jgi:hypothetical protein